MFKYLDKVKIINGFYEECEGILTHKRDKIEDDARITSLYEIEITAFKKTMGYTKSVEELGSNLIKI